jgi:hypothetical protein
MFPISTLLDLARNRMKDAVREREDARSVCQQAANAMEREAREFLTSALAQGWDGDIEAFLRDTSTGPRVR